MIGQAELDVDAFLTLAATITCYKKLAKLVT
jgi:hypothetical protein